MNRQKYPEYFEAFWKSYPRYEDKFEAFNQWKRLKPDAALREDIREGIRHRKEAEKQADEGGEFFPSWPHASRFLKKRRWEDRFPLKKEKREKHEEVPRCPECNTLLCNDREYGNRYCHQCRDVVPVREVVWRWRGSPTAVSGVRRTKGRTS